MITKPQIIRCGAREILDSRGNPTVEATVVLADGTVGVASVPSGASTGIYEAHELRDRDKSRYSGKGVLQAVSNVCNIISPALAGTYASDQADVDKLLHELDGTEHFSKLGANAALAVSLASARAAACWYRIPLYRYLGGTNAHRLPVPMMNVLNGGAHAQNNVEIQEFMIVPVGAESFSEGLRIGSEIYHRLGEVLAHEGLGSGVGDEGGFAPDLASDEQAIEYIIHAIEKSGYNTDIVKISLDAASSEWYVEGEDNYLMPKRGSSRSRDDLISYWASLAAKYPLLSLEDGLDQRDFIGWASLTRTLGSDCMTVGDDLFVTNKKRLLEGISQKSAGAILIKPNQIGTLTDTLDVIHAAAGAGMSYIISHRSGETEDTTIADIAVATNAPFIKSGAPCRAERTAKYNRLLRIEASLGKSAAYSRSSGKSDPVCCGMES
ncbi:MAG: phosphopyruvate hydratase [Clostridia bacterium]|nr:phosphopyruvate hydratase [Clostridia bacterium]